MPKATCWLILFLALPGVPGGPAMAWGQEQTTVELPGSTEGRIPVAPRLNSGTHRFWDRTNFALFLGVGAVRTLDYTSTRHFRARGVDEWLLSNRIVDKKPLFITIEAAGIVASIGLAYWLHRTGHHRLERWVSIIHVSVGGFGSARNYALGNSPPSQPWP